jgi:UDP-N-acetylglucosamine/UDP-N-acetylgalactosamine diphosphorylase
MMMTFEKAKALLEQNGQGHVLAFWKDLDAEARKGLLTQIETIDFEAIRRMQGMLTASAGAAAQAAGGISPAAVTELAALGERERNESLSAYGESALARGEVGVLLVAGGQGSRLGFEGPKGAYPLGPVSNASLFEIHARKVLALERRYGAGIPFYIMTSQANDAATRAFFAENGHFGLSPARVLFFTQGMWPALDPKGRILLETPGRIFMSPDGHGGTITALQDRGMFADMDRRGIRSLFYFQVDNPLVEIADPVFVGLHLKEGADVSTKVCTKRDPQEGLGVVAVRDGQSMIVEYSELTPAQMQERRADGRLKLLFGSVAIHVFSVAFLKREATAALPLHTAFKKVPTVDAGGRTVTPTQPNAYKFEKFIFDVIPDAAVAINVEFERAQEFSPVKNATGSDSPATSQRDMVRKVAGWLEACGVVVPRNAEGDPRHRIEIDPCFAMNEDELAQKLGTGFSLDADLLLDGDEIA